MTSQLSRSSSSPSGQEKSLRMRGRHGGSKILRTDSAAVKSNQRRQSPPEAGQPTWWDAVDTDAEAWGKPIQEDPPVTIEEMKLRESQIHVDLVRDMVPFWIRSVEAAERGEVLRLEEFLEEMAQRQASWSLGDSGRRCEESSTRGWSNCDGWGEGPGVAWGGESRKESDWKWVDEKGGNQRGKRNDGFQFVEKVANSQAAGQERKQQMHTFFEMPTDEKVRKIDEVIQRLRSTCNKI
ncbi:uncharacterized protein LACBIDRAFT_301000 [Laccaria bicolor S238N-H82]|uniref:Predicted protein n=1 Tax=Laccaria bicolor (strain S238N-H82 / ATCC MYA-4686) TaxID=486041 RepID=B0CR32_LACBS|nr:uncharacterized protein LACBIDRAFT_301000 [Laccaria bicolor S238N-H82]EDR15747.1 predicted protein [Laccaria bicolor S238N-H82]|eukprot:XP_001873955.1 predicted protein [Laccaria bicolor S238N-H82]